MISTIIFGMFCAWMSMIIVDGLASATPYLWERCRRPLRWVVSIMPVSLMLYTLVYIIRHS